MNTYEKKHKGEVIRATQLWECGDITRENLEYIFPELKESEDERISREITEFILTHRIDEPNDIEDTNHWLAWLEKQGEQRSKLVDFGYNAKDGDLQEVTYFIPNGFHAEMDGNKVVIKRGEKKTAVDFRAEDWYVSKVDGKIHNIYNSGVEPKFKVGDWVVNNTTLNVCHILKIEHGQYICDDCSFPITKENEYHLWTIQDAKDGDVLCYKDEVFLYKHDIKSCTLKETCFGGMVYYCCYDGKRFITNSMYSLTERDKDNINPATKEQRDLLEKAMTDAGYTFDFEKKELRKIEQKPVWSEEDERILNSIIDDVRPLGECPDYPSDEEREYFYEGYRKVDWLKSLKQRMEG